MKQKTIQTDKATVLVVESKHIEQNDDGYWIPNNDNGFMHLPQGNWKLLGRLSDITEEQWSEVVEDASYKYPYEFKRKYENYNEGDFDFNCSSESGASLLQANDIWFENP